MFLNSEVKNINEKKIPLILLNARLTKKTFKRWMKLKNFGRSIFNYITIAYPQNLETAKYRRDPRKTWYGRVGDERHGKSTLQHKPEPHLVGWIFSTTSKYL